MRKLIVTEFVTLDGVMEAPGGEPTHPHSGWVFDYMGEEQMAFKLQEVLEADAHLIGRVTYESFAGAWPERTGEFADKMNSMPKYVVTTTLDELELEQLDADPGRRGRGGGEAEAAGRRPDPRRRQPHARPHADGARPRRRVPADGLPGRPRLGQTALPGVAAQDPAGARGHATFATGVQVHTYRPAGREAAAT